MLVFRSEERVDRRRELQCLPRGALFHAGAAVAPRESLILEQARAGLAAQDARRTEKVFADIGPTGDFWRLQAS
jgi:hypothetical protein